MAPTYPALLKKGLMIWSAASICIFAILVAVHRWWEDGRQLTIAAECLANLRQINGAKWQWALETRQSVSALPSWTDLDPYGGRGYHFPKACPGGGAYTIAPVGSFPRCSIASHRLEWTGFFGYVADPERRRITAARVQLEDSLGRRINVLTTRLGRIGPLPDDWTNRIVWVSISRTGYYPATFTAPFEYDYNEFLLNHKVLTEAEVATAGGPAALSFVREIDREGTGFVTRDADGRVVRLVLKGDQCRATNLAVVAKLPALRELVLYAGLRRDVLDAEGISALFNCSELSTLVLSRYGRLRPGVIPAIAELPNLRRLQLISTVPPAHEKPVLASLSSRMEVTVTNTLLPRVPAPAAEEDW